MENIPKQKSKPKIGRIIFWILWAYILLIIPFYISTLVVEFSVAEPKDMLTLLSPVVGFLVIIAQITLFTVSYKQMKKKLPLSKAYLTLLGGTIIIASIWLGGCAMMGPLDI